MFTNEEVMQKAREEYPGMAFCIDKLPEAREQLTLQEAVDVIYVDTAYWEDKWREAKFS